MEKLETERNQFQAFQLKYHQEKQEWLGKIEQESRGRQKAMEERQAVFEYASGIERRLHSVWKACYHMMVFKCFSVSINVHFKCVIKYSSQTVERH